MKVGSFILLSPPPDLRNPFKDRADDPSSVAVQFFIAFPAFCAFSFGVFILVMIGRAEKPLCGAVGPTVVWMELVSNLCTTPIASLLYVFPHVSSQ